MIIYCGLQANVAQLEPILKQWKTMVAHVAHNFAISFKFWDQNEAMNLNRNKIIITLRSCFSYKLAAKSYEFVIIVDGLPVGYRQK